MVSIRACIETCIDLKYRHAHLEPKRSEFCALLLMRLIPVLFLAFLIAICHGVAAGTRPYHNMRGTAVIAAWNS